MVFLRFHKKTGPLLLGVGCLLLLAGGCATLDVEPDKADPGVILDTGAYTDRETQWRGMVLGGPFQAPVTGRLLEISRRAGQETISRQMPVVYLSLDGRQRLEAVWLGKGKDDPCHLVRERLFQDGQMVREEVKKVCN
jgi:hypothetical protein